MKPYREGMQFAVVRIFDGHPLYRGDSLAKAAWALDPGTCYGVGQSVAEALTAAIVEADYFRTTQEARP